jgi:hypothetical protein
MGTDPLPDGARMTRALAVAIVCTATLAVVVVGFLVFPKPARLHRREPAALERAAPPSRVFVLAGQSAERAIVLKARYGDPDRAAFTDRALADKLGARAGEWQFVEIWVVNRGPADLRSLEATPTASGPGGVGVVLKPLREIGGGDSRGAAPAMLVADLAPDASQPLRKGAFRRTVYALDGAASFRDLESAEIDGVRLAPSETTEAALETFLERPRPDLIAALAKPEEPR